MPVRLFFALHAKLKSTMVDGRCVPAGYPSPFADPGRQVVNLVPGRRFSEFLSRGMPPRHQFVWLVLPANHPVITHASMKTLRLKRGDVARN